MRLPHSWSSRTFALVSERYDAIVPGFDLYYKFCADVGYCHFAVWKVEPLFCHVMVYDISLCCRVTEEYHFTLPGPSLPKVESSGVPTSVDCAWPHTSEGLHAALLYILPNHQPQQLYLVLKVAMILSGDGDSATAPYCNPEKMSALLEEQKLIDRATDCSQRLGRYRQPLTWGAISLMEGMNRPITLYRQRTAMNDELRIPMIADAVRGTLKYVALHLFVCLGSNG